MKTMTAGLAFTLTLLLVVGNVARAEDAPKKEGEAPKKVPDRPRGGAPGGRTFAPPSNPLFDALDTNKDGVISEEEMKNAYEALKKLDKNSDGKLTRDEVQPAGFGRGFGGGTPGGVFGGGGGRFNASDFVDRIMANDKNKDGKVTKDELPENMQNLLDRFDENKDGALDKAELEKAAQRFGQQRAGGRPGQPGAPGAGNRAGRPKRPSEGPGEKAPSTEKAPAVEKAPDPSTK